MLVARNPESSSDVKERRKLNVILVATRGDWIKQAGFEQEGNNKTYVWLMMSYDSRSPVGIQNCTHMV